MRDRLSIDPLAPEEYYKPKTAPSSGWPKRTTPTVEQLDRAHDNIRKLLKEKDRIIEQTNAQAEVIKQERRWRRWLTTGFAGTWAVILYILKLLLPYVLKGMAR